MKKTALITIILLLVPTVFASSHYSYEHAEELKPLIEWEDYGPDAFKESVEQNKPIFLLITAPSWCYWCQVYESEDYLFHPEVYPYINENFIPIYVDADKRQDLTRKYLEGGWPSTTVLTPNRERLFGYSGVRPMLNILTNLKKSVEYVNSQGFSTQITYDYEKTPVLVPEESQLNALVKVYASVISQSYDPDYGGFGRSRFETTQKFPQPRSLDFSLELYELTGNNQWLELVQNTLQNQYTDTDGLQTNYNLFDPIEGGFHRYGTQRDWTPPHYEKMLYDNARLLKAYVHLQKITPNDRVVNEVVEKTGSYIVDNWFDSENGGFYGNTDVHGEHHYYAENPRPKDKPRVEKTKYTNWNAEAILTYLYLWEQTGAEEYKEMAEKSLDFFAQEMVTEEGAYHYQKEDGYKGVRGNLLDNSYLLLAFTEGYEVLDDKKYLDTANEIAKYSLENLYDWHSGGFFERNSPDTQIYAPGENIDLSKPAEENGVIAYALLKLYEQTRNVEYLNAGIKTLGGKISEAGGLDRGYYIMKAAQFAAQSNLVSEYNTKKTAIKQIEQGKLKNFWVDELVSNSSVGSNFVASNEGVESLDSPLLVLIVVAFLAGLLSIFSPCTLPILPAYVAYTFASSKKNIKGMALSFFLGLALIFSLLGMSATFLGSFLKSNLTIFSQVAGIVIIFFGIYILLGKGFAGLKIKQNKPTTYFGSFMFGSVLGLSWTPCIGPILVAILLMASTSASALTGGVLLFIYAVGLALPLLIFSFYLSKLDRTGKVWRFIIGKELHFSIGRRKVSIHTTSLISGLLFVILGYLMFSGILFMFNQYIVSSSFQNWIFSIEEFILGFLK